MRRRGVAAGILALAWLMQAALAAEDDDPPLSSEGADSCLRCHGDPDEHRKVLSIFQTPHAVKSDARTPFGRQHQCEACHGPGGDHARRLRFGEERSPIPAFGRDSPWSTERENAICLDCHQDSGRMHWAGGMHERAGLGCVDCHSVHAPQDPVLERAAQSAVCLDCHTRERTEFHRASTHPVRFGQMNCASCHEAHGTLNEHMLLRSSLNETCYECHAEKRGPFLWEHAPVTEDCSLCHRPHGSNHSALLTRRAPLLCQQCHSRAGHPSVARTGSDLPRENPSVFLLGSSCINCHSQVHGSNHPSGAGLSR